MAWDLAFDPITGDLIDDGAGGWATTESGDTAVLNQLLIHYAAWWGDPGIGALLHDRRRFAAAPAAQIAAEVRRALGLLVAEELIADVEVSAQETRSGRVDGRTTYRLVETGQLVQLALPAFGG